MGCGGGGSGDGAFGEFVIKFLNQSSRNPVFVPIPVPINVAVSHTATIVLYEIDYLLFTPFSFSFLFFPPSWIFTLVFRTKFTIFLSGSWTSMA